MFDGYMELAGVEIVNSARAAAYSAAAGIAVQCEPCGDLAAAVGDDPYDWYGGVEESAPWFDPTRPESSQVLGVLGLGVSGTEDGQVVRSPTDLVGDGVALGPLRRKGREIGFTVGLVVLGERALSYAIGWLASALRGGACGESACDGDHMCMFSCCPTSEMGVTELRHIYDVGLLEAPAVQSRTFLPGGAIVANVSFTLVAASPWIFSEPLPTMAPDWVDLAQGPVLYGVDPDEVYEECEDEPASCLEDPSCERPAMPPRPPVPRSPCVPTGKATFRQTLINVDPRNVPEWFDLVPLVEVEAGEKDLRRLIVRFWTNPTGGDCGKLTDPCQACFDVSVPFVPAGSTLVVDGRVQRAVVECAPNDFGARASGTPEVYGPGGQTFQWPVFECPTGLCVEVLSERGHTAKDARARVSVFVRGDAA